MFGFIFFTVVMLFTSEAKAVERLTGLVEVPVLTFDRAQLLSSVSGSNWSIDTPA